MIWLSVIIRNLSEPAPKSVNNSQEIISYIVINQQQYQPSLP